MALQTAPLGQLPNMQMPYGISHYEKPAPAWQRALSAIIQGVATSAGQQVGQNIFAKEEAPEFGRQSAGTWDKIVHGPAVSENEARQLRGIGAEKALQEGQHTFQAKELDDRLMAESLAQEAGARNAQTLEGQREQAASDLADIGARNAQFIESQRAASSLKDIQTRAELEAKDPYRLAEGERARAEALKASPDFAAKEILALQKLRQTMGTGGGPGEPTDAVKNHAQGSTRPGAPDVSMSDFLSASADTPTAKLLGAGALLNPITQIPALMSLLGYKIAAGSPTTSSAPSGVLQMSPGTAPAQPSLNDLENQITQSITKQATPPSATEQFLSATSPDAITQWLQNAGRNYQNYQPPPPPPQYLARP